MFCQFCGKPTEGEQTVCAECAAKAAAPQEEVTQVVPQPVQPEAQPQETFQLNTAPEAPVKKKAKKGLVVGIVAAVAVVAAVLAVVFCMDSIKAFFNRTFLSPEDYFVKAETAAVAEYTAEFTQIYGKALQNYATNANGADMELRLNVGKDILSLAETALEEQGMAMDLDWLNDIRISLDAVVEDEAMQMGMGVGLGGETILSADIVYDMAGAMIYMALPELNKDYMSMDMSYAMSGEDMMEVMSQSQALMDELMEALPSEETINKLVTKYVEIALGEIKSVNKSTKTLKVGKASQKVVVLTAKITEKDLYAIATAILEEAEDDKELKKIIDAFSDYATSVNEMNGSDYEVDLYADFSEAIPYALENLEMMEEDADKSNYIKLETYVDMQDNVRGHQLTVYTDGEKDMDPVNVLTAVKGNTTYLEAELGTAYITGQSTEKKGVSQGYYTFTMEQYDYDTEETEEMDIFTVEFENVTDNSATLRLIPSEDIMAEALSDSGIPAALLGDEFALELAYSETEGKTNCEVNVLVDSKTLIGLGLSSAMKDGKVSIPKNALDANNDEDAAKWFSEMDFEGVLSAMDKAGVPSELVEAVRSYVEMYQAYLG